MTSKYSKDTPRLEIDQNIARQVAVEILEAMSVPSDIAQDVVLHLLESDGSDVESHGIWRIHQYAKYYQSGYMKATSRPELKQNAKGAWLVEGHGGIGIPAMNLAIKDVVRRAKDKGLAAIAIQNAGHTGRLGSYAEYAADQGCLAIIIGGGGRKDWRLVAPYGGSKALMSTNPYAIGIPGGKEGPVIADFATSAAAAGWVYGAKIAGATLPEGVLIDKDGNASTDPEAYFSGGAILPAGGAKGYALAVAAEMIAEAMLGPVTVECHWLILALDCSLYQTPSTFQSIAEEILLELRECPPAQGFDRVFVPGERESEARKANQNKPISLPTATWQEILELAQNLGVNTATF
jgi:LDH2 family malate/lactate/ureidoglycolate dehydrogenase